MIDRRATIRRFSLALTGIGVSALLLRSQVSISMVVRGDDLLYRGQTTRALQMYERAQAFDGDDEAAVDRYAFAAFLSRRPVLVQRGIAATTVFLKRHPHAAAILNDRALLDHAASAFADAARDFARVGGSLHDPRAFTFAGFDALRAGDARGAKANFERALALNAHFLPALHGLARTERWTRS
jgi:Tfp pilus assembly protein PilF